MEIDLSPEDLRLIQERIESGEFQTVEEVIHDALTARPVETEDWMAHRKGEISEKIRLGLDQLERGEVSPIDEALARLEQRKANWLAAHSHPK
jgi:Arc/MetJ-type ribon-helix-helix transcriptional regulator